MALRYLGINDVTEDLLYKEAATTEERGTATIDLAKALIKLFDSKIKVEYKEDDAEINIDKFEIKKPTLNDIFIEKVGEC